MIQYKTFTREEIIADLSVVFPTFDFKFVDNGDGSFVLSANGVLMKSVSWSEDVKKELVEYLKHDPKFSVLHILERTITRHFDFDGTNWVEAGPKPTDSHVFGFYGDTFMDTGFVYCPYVPRFL